MVLTASRLKRANQKVGYLADPSNDIMEIVNESSSGSYKKDEDIPFQTARLPATTTRYKCQDTAPRQLIAHLLSYLGSSRISSVRLLKQTCPQMQTWIPVGSHLLGSSLGLHSVFDSIAHKQQ